MHASRPIRGYPSVCLSVLYIAMSHTVDQILTFYKNSYASRTTVKNVEDIEDIPRRYRLVASYTPIEGAFHCVFTGNIGNDYQKVEWTNNLQVHVGREVRLHAAPMYSYLECLRRAAGSNIVYYMTSEKTTDIFMDVR